MSRKIFCGEKNEAIQGKKERNTGSGMLAAASMEKKMNEQISIFEYLETLSDAGVKFDIPLQPGTKIGRIVLGEVEEAVITKVEGNENYFFYRTDRGCFSKDEAETNLEQLYEQAKKARKQYKTIENYPLERRQTIAYPPKDCDQNQKVTYAQIGIFQNMLYWKEAFTYEFLIPFQDRKKLEKEYQKKLKSMTIDFFNKKPKEYTVLSEQLPSSRLYWSRHGYYASARYVEHEG